MDHFESVLDSLEPLENQGRQFGSIASIEPISMASSDTLEYLCGWARKQDQITQRTAEHQKRVEEMMQTLLQQNVLPGPVTTSSTLAKARMASPRESTSGPSDVQTADGDGAEEPYRSSLHANHHEDECPDLLPGQVISDNLSEHSLGKLHAIFVDAIWHVPSPAEADHRTWHYKALEHVVEHPYFEYFAAVFIFAHSIFIGVSVEYLASVSSEKHPVLGVGNVLFVSVFCVEVGLKFLAERQEFILGHEWKWNAFDVLLILTVLIELVMGVVLSGKNEDQKSSMKTVVKIAEMVRTIRILRIFRMLKFSLTLRVIVAKILSSARSLVWVLILFSLMVYVVSVCLTQGCNDFLDGEQHLVGPESLTGTKQEMLRYFGSIPRSSFTLFASISGGLVWSEVADVLGEAGSFYACMFVMFQALSLVAVMNLITGIFVGNAINSDTDIVMEAEAQERDIQADYLRKMFTRMDLNNSGSISLDEFQRFAHNPELEVYLKPLNIDADEAETLFHLLDEDGSGTIGISEFLAGCMDLRGQPRSIDVKVLLHEHKRLRHKIGRHVQDMQKFAVLTEDMLATMSTLPRASTLKTAAACDQVLAFNSD